MHNHHHANSLDRRLFLAGSAAVLAVLPGAGRAQNAAAQEQRLLSARMAEFITRFDLKDVPPLAVENTRVAFIDKIAAPVANKLFECGLIP